MRRQDRERERERERRQDRERERERERTGRCSITVREALLPQEIHEFGKFGIQQIGRGRINMIHIEQPNGKTEECRPITDVNTLRDTVAKERAQRGTKGAAGGAISGHPQ